MQVGLHRGRLRVTIDAVDPEILEEQKLLIHERIGSANDVKGTRDQVSCALSVHNLRKLRELGAITDKSPEIREIIEKLRGEKLVYDRETALGDLVKQGKITLDDLIGDVGYKFKLPPFDHQRIGVSFLHAIQEVALFGDCGTGKTFIVLTFIESLNGREQKWLLFVVCPINLIRHVWQEDAKKFTDLSCASLRPDIGYHLLARDFEEGADKKDDGAKAVAKKNAKKRRGELEAEMFNQVADVFVINPETIRGDGKGKERLKQVMAMMKRYRKEGYKWCFAIDESSKIKSRTSSTYKALQKIRALCDRCIIMTGTPSPNGILDLWAQFCLLDGGKTLQPNFVDFRHDTHKTVIVPNMKYTNKRTGKEEPVPLHRMHPNAPTQVHKIIKPRAIRFRTDDCIDLPAMRILLREVPLSPQQREVYDDMENMLYAELEGEPVTAKIAASKLIKLREVTGGFIRTDEGEDKQIGKSVPKMEVLDELLEQSIADNIYDKRPSKAIIWSQYRWECKTLIKRYGRKYGAKGLYGAVTASAKDKNIQAFKDDPKCKLIVCHPASVGHGLNLSEANFAFYYSLDHNYENLYQSYRRMARPGQTRHMTCYFLVAPDTIDEDIMTAMKGKKDLSDIVTDGKFDRNSFLEARKEGQQIELQWEAIDV